ncbi:hypothetical protein Tco_0344783 [Tanacetum coccineum]
MDHWEPKDLEINPKRDEILREQMQISIEVFNNSEFLIRFREQLEWVIRPMLPSGTHILNLEWIGECEFFYPTLTQTEVNYLVNLGFSSIGRDEWGENMTWGSLQIIVLLGNNLQIYLKRENKEVKKEQGQDKVVTEEKEGREEERNVKEVEKEKEKEEVSEMKRYIHILRRNIQKFEIDTFREDESAFSNTAWQIFKQL